MASSCIQNMVYMQMSMNQATIVWKSRSLTQSLEKILSSLKQFKNIIVQIISLFVLSIYCTRWKRSHKIRFQWIGFIANLGPMAVKYLTQITFFAVEY
ncbi:unnamed protein product [Leptidea sinapis]|uniref:Uncharacterized protein n=1 Tax=Leptidea sinapis TaxID=189913 RepID=A0A5E4PLF1_9NEOP|nr:unnamed protein product [Leptidea sinapis]